MASNKTIKDNLEWLWNRKVKGYVRGRWSTLLHKNQDIKRVLNHSISSGRCLKVYKDWGDDGLDMVMGREDYKTKLGDLILIQNIFAIYGLAPRVYKVHKIIHYGGTRLALEMDYLGERRVDKKEQRLLKEKIKKLASQFHITTWEQELETNFNYINSKFVDFHGFKINKEKYKADLIARINNITHFGKAYNGRRAAYQQTNEFEGKRKTKERLDKMKIDFKGKRVLDIGCNLGVFCIEAASNGAKYVEGWDIPDNIKLAKEWANLSAQWQIEYFGSDLTEQYPKGKFDIVLFLAMEDYLGIPEWLHKTVDNLLYVEGHDYSDNEALQQELAKNYTVDNLGEINDRGNRILLKCSKK